MEILENKNSYDTFEFPQLTGRLVATASGAWYGGTLGGQGEWVGPGPQAWPGAGLEYPSGAPTGAGYIGAGTTGGGTTGRPAFWNDFCNKIF